RTARRAPGAPPTSRRSRGSPHTAVLPSQSPGKALHHRRGTEGTVRYHAGVDPEEPVHPGLDTTARTDRRVQRSSHRVPDPRGARGPARWGGFESNRTDRNRNPATAAWIVVIGQYKHAPHAVQRENGGHVSFPQRPARRPGGVFP